MGFPGSTHLNIEMICIWKINTNYNTYSISGNLLLWQAMCLHNGPLVLCQLVVYIKLMIWVCFGFFVAEITNYYRKLASTKKESICEDPPYIIDVSENQKKERVKS